MYMDKAKIALREKYSNREEWKEVIYDLMNGTYDLEKYPMEESGFIRDEFAKGEFCERSYTEVHEAKQRLYQKLGVTADADVELIIALFEQISHHLAMKMYDYGELFSEK